MLKTFAMCLGLGVLGAVLAAAVKWAGALRVPIDFLYGFYAQSPVFEKIHGAVEFVPVQIAVLLVSAVATAWATAGIPHIARRLVIVLGAVLITFFLSPVLALLGWKVEPFSWLIGLASAAISSAVVFSARNPNTASGTERDEEEEREVRNLPSRMPTHLLRTPEMALAAAEKAASAAATDEEESVRDEIESGADTTSNQDFRTQASIVVVEVFPPQETVDGYTGAARAFLERACTFLLSTGAANAEQSLDFVRTVFPATEEEGGCNHSVIEATQAAILLKSHLLEFCEASDQEPMSSLRFGIGVECFAWSAPELELPISVRDGIRALCLANKRFGSQIVIGARAQRLAGDSIEVRPLELMEDPDTGLPLEVYELLGESGNLSDDELLERDAFWEGVVCLRSGNHDGAIERFERARSGEKVDPVLDYYLARSRGEELEDDLTHGDAADEEIDSIPVAYYRESDSEDRMETFIDVEDAVEPQIAPEKQ